MANQLRPKQVISENASERKTWDKFEELNLRQ